QARLFDDPRYAWRAPPVRAGVALPPFSAPCFPLKPLLCLCGGEHHQPHADLARHILEPLDLGVAEAATRCRASSQHIDLLDLGRELTCRMAVRFRKLRPIEVY